MFAYCSTLGKLRHWCYLACVTPVHLAADTEQVIVQFIYLHMLFANWTLTCLALAALGTLLFPCCCNFGALVANFEQVTVSVYEQVFVQFNCLPMLLTILVLTCSTSATLGALVLSCLFNSNSLTSFFERVIVAVYFPMLFADCPLTCLASAALGALVLLLFCIYRISAGEFKQVIFAVWTLNYLNPTAHRAPYLICLSASTLAANFEKVIGSTSHSFSIFIFCIFFRLVKLQ